MTCILYFVAGATLHKQYINIYDLIHAQNELILIKVFFALKYLNTFTYLCFRSMTFHMLLIDVNSLVVDGIPMKGITVINELVF